jgi:hypothetical protein
LACFDAPPIGGTAGKTALLFGIIQPFANGGCDPGGLLGVKLEIFTVKRTGDPATDGALDQPVASLIVDDTLPLFAESVSSCNGGPRYARKYEIPNVPMYTELVIRTAGSSWAPLYTYDVYLSEQDPSYSAGSGSGHDVSARHG